MAGLRKEASWSSMVGPIARSMVSVIMVQGFTTRNGFLQIYQRNRGHPSLARDIWLDFVSYKRDR